MWRTPTVLALAAHIMERGSFDAMPILADALEDAGCDNRLLLDHCRHGSGHWFTCWSLKLILGATPPIAPLLLEPPPPSAEVEYFHSGWEHPQTVRDWLKLSMIPLGAMLITLFMLSIPLDRERVVLCVKVVLCAGGVGLVAIIVLCCFGVIPLDSAARSREQMPNDNDDQD